MHGKFIRQRNVKEDNTMDRVGTLPLKWHDTRTIGKQQFDSTERHGNKVPCGNGMPPNSDEDVSAFSVSDIDSDSKEEVDPWV